jgi:hypothetical protein
MSAMIQDCSTQCLGEAEAELSGVANAAYLEHNKPLARRHATILIRVETVLPL